MKAFLKDTLFILWAMAMIITAPIQVQFMNWCDEHDKQHWYEEKEK